MQSLVETTQQNLKTLPVGECVNQFDCDNHFTKYTYVKLSCYALNTHTYNFCQLYFTKTGGGERDFFINVIALSYF